MLLVSAITPDYRSCVFDFASDMTLTDDPVVGEDSRIKIKCLDAGQ
jgi:hypothetical protein